MVLKCESLTTPELLAAGKTIPDLNHDNEMIRTNHGPALAAHLVALVFMSVLFAGCFLSHVENPVTRTETDYYTITDRDTVSREVVRNSPGSVGDNGVVFPSSRETHTLHNTLSHDSTHDRNYPNFLRAGGLENAGLLGSSSSNGLGPGLFGIFALFNSNQILTNDSTPARGTIYKPDTGAHPKNSNGNQLFKGELIRAMPYEYRLRWFNDAPNWTVGWSALELLAPDENRKNWLTSYATNIYLRRRFYISDQIPYLIFSPFLGVSAYPSMYVNIGGELQLGSLAGMNLRAYAGFADGFTWLSNSNSNFPYFGLGVSVLDFTNTAEETEHEWKYYTHTGIDVNIFELTLLATSQKYTSILQDTAIPFNGMQMKFATVEIPLPILNYHLWAGTSLINWMGMGFENQAIGILPLRVGYRQYLFGEDLMVEPFFEYDYYPSTVFNMGAQIKLDTWTHENIGITLGYASGSPGAFLPQLFNTAASMQNLNISTAYIGISVFLGDWDKTPEAVREMHASKSDPWSGQ